MSTPLTRRSARWTCRWTNACASRRRGSGRKAVSFIKRFDLHALSQRRVIVPTLRVVMPPLTLCVIQDAERPGRRAHAERGNDQLLVSSGQQT
ncbi:MAG: hypothetical protein EOP13_26500 [Pseudomonas sp.]|nr:MAG: hypothetical protein EOP13_26500 [Pseudomonas sp.]